jgi:hypothetical protein
LNRGWSLCVEGELMRISFQNLTGVVRCTVKAAPLACASRPGKTLVCAPWLPTCRAVRSLGDGHVDP